MGFEIGGCRICGSFEHDTATHSGPGTPAAETTEHGTDGRGRFRSMNGGKSGGEKRSAGAPYVPGMPPAPGRQTAYPYPPGHPSGPPMPPPPTEEEHQAKQKHLDQMATVRLARSLLLARRSLDVSSAFALADEFAAEALRRLPHTTIKEGERLAWIDGHYPGPMFAAGVGRRFGDMGE